MRAYPHQKPPQVESLYTCTQREREIERERERERERESESERERERERNNRITSKIHKYSSHLQEHIARDARARTHTKHRRTRVRRHKIKEDAHLLALRAKRCL